MPTIPDLEKELAGLLKTLRGDLSQNELSQVALKLKALELLHKVQGSTVSRKVGVPKAGVHPAASKVQT